ncbi:MAG: hypothetical protein PVG65_00590 [Candidatus Thorarchaeota archaeon]|jgi:hypothetical protein
MKKRKVGEVCYFIKNGYFGKCRIESIVTVESKEGTVINYQIHPYGLEKSVQIHEEDIKDTFEEARQEALELLKMKYEKNVETIKNDTEEKFDTWEAEYQKAKKVEDESLKHNV